MIDTVDVSLDRDTTGVPFDPFQENLDGISEPRSIGDTNHGKDFPDKNVFLPQRFVLLSSFGKH